MATVIYNCKHCKRGKRVEYNAGWEGNARVKRGPLRLDANGRRVFPGASNQGEADNRCDHCYRAMSWHYLRAFANTSTPCNDKCITSRTHICNCSCGGKNHGTAA